MLFDERLDQLIADLISQWNVAERRIKKAEQVGGEEAVGSAIFELRYAGRKLIDVLHLLQTKDWKNDNKTYELICRNLADAIEDCVKAKHDAIDAMVDFIVIWFDEIETAIGIAKLIELFPEYLGVTARIAGIQQKVIESRGNRVAGRDGVYDNIETTDYDTLLALFQKMKVSAPRVQAMVDQDNWRKKRDFLLLLGTFITGLALVGLTIYEIFFAK